MREPVVDFLNHGMLPFVGRERELERLLSFWKGTADSTGLRALLLTGEAGSGKSRLIEQTIPPIEAEGGTVVHARLRADSALALAPLLSLALWSSASAGPLLREEPEPSLSAVIGAVRRLCRLRRTVLILEDAHLLEGGALREFGLFVEALADESLALIVAARPAELTARGSIEAWLVEEIPLPPLQRHTLQELWSRLFGEPDDSEAIDALQEATLGNPLAFRSALRGAINAGLLTNDGREWRVTVPAGTFREMAVRSAQRLTEGMLSHLTDEERDAAAALATLGEVFAPEGAAQLIPDAERMVSRLLFKGILVRGNTAATSLRNRNVRGLPLIFAHSLLHRTLLEQGTGNPLPLMRVIASDVPLYSVTPFLFLEEHPPAETVGVPFALDMVEKSQQIAARIDRTADWQLALRIWSVTERIAEKESAADPDHPERTKLRLHLMLYRTNLMGRNDESDDYFRQTDALLTMLEGSVKDGEEWTAAIYLRAITFLFRFSSRRNRAGCPQILIDAAETARRFSSPTIDDLYTAFLRVAASCAYIYGFYLNDLLHVERESRRLTAQKGEDPELRRRWLNEFGYYLLSSFTTSEELAEKRILLAELRKARVDVPYYYIREIAFQMETGEFRRALELIDKYRPPLRDIGLHRTIYSTVLFECEALAALGAPVALTIAKGMEVISDPQAPANDLRRNHLGRHLVAGAAMRGTFDDIEEVARKFAFADEEYPLVVRILLALPSLEALRNVALVRPASGPGSVDLDDPDTDLEELIPAARALLERRPLAGDEDARLQRFLREPILRRYRMLGLQAAFALVRALEEAGLLREDEERTEALRSGIRSLLAWLAERQLGLHGTYLLREHGTRLNDEEQKEWTELFSRVAGSAAADRGTEEKTAVTMFGAITVRRPGGETERIRGARNHLLLGLLVADRMLKNPLTRNAFVALASGVEDDPERGRRTMNMAVLRLREAAGPDLILTDQETPRLNTARVTVDLIEARKRLNAADRLVRNRRLRQATGELREVFRLSGGDVPFPGLYEELFGNLRSEFEEDLQRVTALLGRSLIAEGDDETAEEILAQGVDLVPESEELQGLLRRALNGMRGTEEEAEQEMLLAGE